MSPNLTSRSDRPLVKICGVTRAEAVAACLASGVDMMGFVFYDLSPRNISLARAAELRAATVGRMRCVALTVDADDDLFGKICTILDPDLLQLHGAESSARCADIRARFGRPVMKALAVETGEDLRQAEAYAPVVDWIVFDAKPPKDTVLPGGNGRPFNWSILSGFNPGRPWLLSGGLDARNVAAAIAETGAPGVDVSSGVETAPGVKDPAEIAAFVAATRA